MLTYWPGLTAHIILPLCVKSCVFPNLLESVSMVLHALPIWSGVCEDSAIYMLIFGIDTFPLGPHAC
jgi:hypothetical protein